MREAYIWYYRLKTPVRTLCRFEGTIEHCLKGNVYQFIVRFQLISIQAGFYEHDNTTLVFIKLGQFLDDILLKLVELFGGGNMSLVLNPGH
jgi:hypothetical protein